MRIINLAENTEGASGCGFEHGLCFYVETEHHKLLMDTGHSDLFIKNAKKLGIDLTQVDTVVISHGHDDHGGGILPFVKINPSAKIYLQEEAFGDFYSSNRGSEIEYIGLDKKIRELPQAVIVDAAPLPGREEAEDGAEKGIFRIDSELSLFTGIGNEHPVSSANHGLKRKTEEGLVQDDFRHEQCLVISEGSRNVLLSGCAHHGILNILDRYRELYGGAPDVVISGFHMMNKNGYSDEDITVIIDTALALRKLNTVFYTGHCTGVDPYNAMKKLMGSQLHYVHSGDEIVLQTLDDGSMDPESGKTAQEADVKEPQTGKPAADVKTREEALRIAKKKRREYMKWHRFFAWGTVVCFVLTMVTGYQRK